jgi:UDP-glucose 4-epimerase
MPQKNLTVAITGANGSLGRLVVASLLENDAVGTVVALDLAPPELKHPKLLFEALDLTRPTADRELAKVLAEQKADRFLHLAFFSSQIRNAVYAHEVEALGTVHVLSACVEAGVPHLVMSSTTTVYGASPQNPNFLGETHPLVANSRSRFVADKVEAEQQVRRFRAKKPGLAATVLRFAPTVGPTIENPFTRYLSRRLAPTVLGYDPLLQFLHEEDAVAATVAVTLAPRPGTFNIVGRGVLPLSLVLRLLGASALPLPHPWAKGALRALGAVGVVSMPPTLIDYVRYLWVADGRLAEKELSFRPRYSSREALLAFARRLKGSHHPAA